MEQKTAEKPGQIMRMMIRLMPKITPIHAWMYRSLNGKFVNKATGGAPVLLVTTTGRHSGKPRTVVLGYLADGVDYVVAGTNGGNHALPAWVYNLQADPNAEVQQGGSVIQPMLNFCLGRNI